MTRSILITVVGLVAGVLAMAPTTSVAQAPTCFGSQPTIVAVAGVTTVGTAGPDVILGTAGGDVILGRGGNDKICSRGGADRVEGGPGSDRINLGRGADTGIGGAGSDVILGKHGRDVLRGNGGADTLDGGSGPDQLFGGGRGDVLHGRAGNDVLRGQAGADTLAGGTGIDGCIGGKGVDRTSGCDDSPNNGHFRTLPPGAALPSGAQCAARVRPSPEVRPENRSFNDTRGASPAGGVPRVTGDFTGTTDEILQWAACKHGIDEDLVRAQMAVESWWRQRAGGDLTTIQSRCHQNVRTGSGQCPESNGMGQIKYRFHGAAYERANALRSTAYNVDYTYARWRSCYNGELTWLNTVNRGREYRAGDLLGCMGVWFSGRWYAAGAQGYIDEVLDYHETRIWETRQFRNG